MASDTEIIKMSANHKTSEDVPPEGDFVQEMEYEEDYTDPKTIVPPESLQELISRLHKVFAKDDINIDYVKTLMESYRSNPREWKKFAKFDPHRLVGVLSLSLSLSVCLSVCLSVSLPPPRPNSHTSVLSIVNFY